MEENVDGIGTNLAWWGKEPAFSLPCLSCLKRCKKSHERTSRTKRRSEVPGSSREPTVPGSAAPLPRDPSPFCPAPWFATARRARPAPPFEPPFTPPAAIPYPEGTPSLWSVPSPRHRHGGPAKLGSASIRVREMGEGRSGNPGGTRARSERTEAGFRIRLMRIARR